MKKKLVSILLLTTIVFCGLNGTSVIAASDSNTESVSESSYDDSSFSFRDLSWWDTKANVEQQLTSEGAKIKQLTSNDSILRMSGIDYIAIYTGKDCVDGGGIVGRYSGLNVAGYTPSDTRACYIYTLNDDGTINKDEDTAQFYFGWYTFEANDYTDGEGVYSDLHQKLQSLYGEGIVDDTDDYFSTTTWKDSEGNQIRLQLGGKDRDSRYVTLGYMAADADSKLDEMQVAVDNEAIAAEAAEREANKDDLSGL